MRISLKLCILLIFVLTIVITIVELIKTDIKIPFVSNTPHKQNTGNNDLDNGEFEDFNENEAIKEKYLELIKTLDFKWGPTFIDKDGNIISNGNSTVDTIANSNDKDENKTTVANSVKDVGGGQTTSNTEVVVIKQCRNSDQGGRYVSDEQGHVCLRKNINFDNGCCKSNFTRNLESEIGLDIYNEDIDDYDDEDNINDGNFEAVDDKGVHSSSSSENNGDLDSKEIKKRVNRLTRNREFKRFSCKGCHKGCCNIYEFCVSCCMSNKNKSTLTNTLGRLVEKGINPTVFKNQFDLCRFQCRTSSKSLIRFREYKDPTFKFCYG